MARFGPRKYDPLRDYLAAQPAGVAELTLSLAAISMILGAPLPATAGRPPSGATAAAGRSGYRGRRGRGAGVATACYLRALADLYRSALPPAGPRRARHAPPSVRWFYSLWPCARCSRRAAMGLSSRIARRQIATNGRRLRHQRAERLAAADPGHAGAASVCTGAA